MSTFKVSSRVAAALACLALVALPVSAEAGKNTIRSVHSKDASGATRILIKGTSTPTFTVYKLDRPARVIVDIAGSELATSLDRTGEGKAVWKLNSWAVGDVTAHPLARSGASVVRFVVGMARPGRYDVKAVGNDVLITVTARDEPPVANDAAARAQAERARAEAERARAAAAAAEQRAEKEIAAARAEAARARAALKSAQKRADEQVDAARADARKAIAEAEKRAEQAKHRLAAASAKMAEADRRLDEVKALRQRAEKAESRAKAALSAAASARAEAAAADQRAAERRAEAEKAAKAAERYRAEAAAAAGDSKKAASLRKRAERAAKDAEERRAKAEKAAAVAEARRAAAERAAGEAEKRKSVAQAAVAEAEAERARADGAKQRAEAERARAEAERAAADKRRQLAEAAAAEAKQRAIAARELREKEELALRRAAAAREQAEKRKAEAERARAALVASIAEARKAKQLADSRRDQVDAARKRVAAQTDDKARARAAAELKRYESQLAAAEQALAKHNQAVAGKRRQVAALDARRDKAARELRQLRAAAASARSAREGEESKLAELIQRRADEEKQLASARKAREQAERRAAEAERRAAEAERRAADAAAKAKSSKRAAARPPKVRIRKVGFDDGATSSKVTIALSAPSEPKIVDADGRRQILEFTDATIARSLERTLDTSKYRGPVRAVSSYRSRKNPGVVRVVVDLDGKAKSRLRRVGNDYHWEFAKPARTAKRSKRATPRKTARSSRIPAPVVGGYGSTSTPIAQQTVAQVSNGRRVYRGTKIDLDFKDADIHNLLRLLADVGGVNIVIPDEIKYRVTVRMRRVPWDQALEVILASKGLWYERNGNLYRIAPRKELDAEAQAEAERRAAMVQQEVPQPEYITLNYAVADDVQEQVRQMLSPKGSMQVDERTNTIVVIDVRANRRNIANLLARLDTPTPQIQIEARIVEARSTFNREIGVQWGGSAISSAATGNATGLIFPNSVAVRGGAEDNQTTTTGVAAPSDFAVNLPAAVGSGAGGALGFSLGSVGGNFNLSLRLSALEDQGTVRIVSSPKITVVNNVEAKISQGVSIPISVVSANGVQTQFVPADLELTVTPTVSQRDCAITMDINVKKNEADFVNTGARGDPTILRKEAKTRVLVADGATTVIGGVYTRNTGLSYSKVPFFADLPVIGWFFKKRQENDERSEILVFITPKITNKASLRCE